MLNSAVKDNQHNDAEEEKHTEINAKSSTYKFGDLGWNVQVDYEQAAQTFSNPYTHSTNQSTDFECADNDGMLITDSDEEEIVNTVNEDEEIAQLISELNTNNNN